MCLTSFFLYKFFNMHLDIGKYWIENVSDVFRKDPTLSNLIVPVLLYIGYIVVFIYGGIGLLKNKEIKKEDENLLFL